MSTLQKRSSVRSTQRRAASSSTACAPTPKARSPTCAAAASAASCLRAVSTTFAPAAASCCEIASPIPREAPVTIAVRPVRSCAVIGCTRSLLGRFEHVCTWYAKEMLAKINLIKPLVVAGAVAAAIAGAPAASADAFAVGPAMTTPATSHIVFKDDPGGGGCDANGNCGSGGIDNGPNGGPGGQGCAPRLGCGAAAQFSGPGRLPGGPRCRPCVRGFGGRG